MNELGASPDWLPADELLRERLSRLRLLVPRSGGDPAGEDRLLRDLQEKCLRKAGPLRLLQEALGDRWEAVAVLVLLCLLGLDLVRIIRWLLG
jgi:hypothetical protein